MTRAGWRAQAPAALRMARYTIPEIIEQATVLPAAQRPLVVSLFHSLRPSQWTKNLIILGALLFGQRLLDPHSLLYALDAFAIFCGLSGVVYLINDIVDRKADREHPVKMFRPIASGAVPVRVAAVTAVVIAAAALTGSFWLRPLFGVLAVSYLALLTLYSGPLKHIVIIDVLTIAIGFVLRAAAGAVAIDVAISHWLYVLTILLALFLALSKRRHELVLLADRATGHRPILEEYSPYLLDQMISVVTASTLVAYAFYTISPETVAKFGTDYLGLTLPFPIYGIFRYLYLVHLKEGGGSPAEMMLTDRPLLICVGLWALATAIIIYESELLSLVGAAS
jgi:4-hydroxybenzoate polyprenyltransferase